MFIDDQYITSLLDDAKNASPEQIDEVLSRAERFEGLSHKDVALLLQTEDPAHLSRIFEIAGKIKEHIYGDRVVMFAPLYISDYCINQCAYCGFNCTNNFNRQKLTQEEVQEEVRLLEKMGHKRLALEAGEDPENCPIDYVLDCIKTIYNMKFENGEIRRVNVNIAATTVEEYRMLRDAQIGTYILFQETYHKETYEKMHIAGPKSNYDYHTTAFDRAMEAGIEDVGGGVLFGLYDHRYEILGLMLHNEHLEQQFGVGFHTVSVPRICDAEGIDRTRYQYAVKDEDFKKIVAIIRLAIPFTGMIISTREDREMRKFLINIGISQVSGGSTVEVGGYAKRESKSAQFQVADERSPMDIMKWLMSEDLVPSFCTACYRKGRTGDRFMQLAKTGNIKNVCLPNALMTLWEYAIDYGDAEFKERAWDLIQQKCAKIDRTDIQALVQKNLKLLEDGQRDIYL